MATPPNDDTRALFKLLADGQWHNYEELRDQLGALVPPGRALRKYEERVEYKRKYLNDPTYDTDASEDERIFFGRRACAQIVITSWKGRGVVSRGKNESKEIRIRPGFKTWGVDHMGPDEEDQPEESQAVPEPPPEDSEPSEPDQGVPKPMPEQGTAHIMPWQLKQFQDPPQRRATEVPVEAVEEIRSWGSEEPITTVVFTGPAVQVPEPLAEAVARNAEQILKKLDQARSENASELLDPPVDYYDHTSPSVTQKPEPQECDVCGSAVLSQEAHEKFHEDYELKGSRSDMALFAESEIRSLLGDVMGQVLDDFQEGMQMWMVTQFAQLEGQIFAARGGLWRGNKGFNQRAHRQP